MPARQTKSQVLLGAHMSIGGGVHMAIERGCSINCTAVQIFVKNKMQWFARPFTQEEIAAFLSKVHRDVLLSIFAQGNYPINYAARNVRFQVISPVRNKVTGTRVNP